MNFRGNINYNECKNTKTKWHLNSSFKKRVKLIEQKKKIEKNGNI